MQHKKLKICLVTNDFPALTETFITTKALELAKRGHTITVISNRVGGSLNKSHQSEIKKAGIKVLYFPAIYSTKDILKTIVTNPATFYKSISFKPSILKKNYKAALQKQLLNQQSFDIIHFEFSGIAIEYINAIDELKGLVVVSCRGTAEKVKPLSVPGRKETLQRLFTKVHAIHCVSADMAKTITQYVDENSKIFINRPAIDASIFKRKKAYPQNHFELQILSIGRFTFQKGYFQGLLAMKGLQKRGIQFKWKIVGDGPLLEEIIYHIHTLGLTDCIELLGKKNRDEIVELYQIADIFLLPSIYEGIANVCLEAMAMELPVVATRSGGMEEVIENGVNGMLCNVYSPEGIEEQILQLCNDFEMRKKMGEEARKTIMEKQTIQQQADIFETEYYKVTNRSI